MRSRARLELKFDDNHEKHFPTFFLAPFLLPCGIFLRGDFKCDVAENGDFEKYAAPGSQANRARGDVQSERAGCHPSLVGNVMRSNRVKSDLAAGKHVFGTMVFEFFTPGMPQIAKAAGAEFVLFDMEHPGVTIETLKGQMPPAGVSTSPPWSGSPRCSITSLHAVWTWAPWASWSPWSNPRRRRGRSSPRPAIPRRPAGSGIRDGARRL